jgi:RNA polymerase sigma-70 factor (ECF subfamily)
MGELYRRHCGRVTSVMRRFAGADPLADDWAQEAWIRAFKALPRFRGDARFSTWLHRIAVNTALSGARDRKRRESRRVERGPEPAIAPAPLLLRRDLERAIARLPEGMRRVLVLHDIEGYTHAEIGELLGIAEGTSKSQLFKARGKMRALIGPERARSTRYA